MSKYRAVRTSCGIHEHASKREAKRCGDLCIMLAAHEISNLKQQPVLEVSVKGIHICDYRADFVYNEKNGTRVIEDCKGMRTPVYRLKKKLVEALYGITIKET